MDIGANPADEDATTMRRANLSVQQELAQRELTQRELAQRELTGPKISGGLVLSALLLVLAGCGSSKPDFLQTSQRDCQRGMPDACAMLAALHPIEAEDPAIAPPVHSREIVQAILAGMRRVRLQANRDYGIPTPRAEPDEAR